MSTFVFSGQQKNLHHVGFLPVLHQPDENTFWSRVILDRESQRSVRHWHQSGARRNMGVSVLIAAYIDLIWSFI